MAMTRSSRFASLAVAMLLALAACGGSSGGARASGTGSATTTPAPASGPAALDPENCPSLDDVNALGLTNEPLAIRDARNSNGNALYCDYKPRENADAVVNFFVVPYESAAAARDREARYDYDDDVFTNPTLERADVARLGAWSVYRQLTAVVGPYTVQIRLGGKNKPLEDALQFWPLIASKLP